MCNFQIAERPASDVSFCVAEVDRPAIEDRGMMLEAASLTPFKVNISTLRKKTFLMVKHN